MNFWNSTCILLLLLLLRDDAGVQIYEAHNTQLIRVHQAHASQQNERNMETGFDKSKA